MGYYVYSNVYFSCKVEIFLIKKSGNKRQNLIHVTYVHFHLGLLFRKG